MDVNDIHASAGATLDNRGGEREESLRQNVEVRSPSMQQHEGPANIAQQADGRVLPVTVRYQEPLAVHESGSVGETPSQQVGNGRANMQATSVPADLSRQDPAMSQIASMDRHVEARHSVYQQHGVTYTQDPAVRHSHVESAVPTQHRDQLTIHEAKHRRQSKPMSVEELAHLEAEQGAYESRHGGQLAVDHDQQAMLAATNRQPVGGYAGQAPNQFSQQVNPNHLGQTAIRGL